MAGKLEFQFDFTNPNRAARKQSSSHRVLIIGDFSRGKGVPLAQRKPVRVTVDNLDSLLTQMQPALNLTLEPGQTEVSLQFKALDHFHPDSLFTSAGVFAELRQLRKRLENPATFAAAAAELNRNADPQATPSETSQAGEASLFEQLIGGAVIQPEQKVQSQVETLIQKLLQPHLGSNIDFEQQKQLIAAIDATIAETLRKILHHPRFQALESNWRGLNWLVERLEESEEQGVYLLDVSLQDIGDDLVVAGGQVEKTLLWRVLGESSLAVAGGQAWDLLLGLYRFGETPESLALVELFGVIAARCGGVFIADASPLLLGAETQPMQADFSDWSEPPAQLSEFWQTLRLSPAAPYVGLALPRFLLRRPYGKKSDPIDQFQFEELHLQPAHVDFLWGNAGLACAELISRYWQEGEFPQAVEDLPYHVYDDGSGLVMKPCAEVFLYEQTALKILEEGLMVLLSVRNQTYGLIPRVQSIALPATNLIP